MPEVLAPELKPGPSRGSQNFDNIKHKPGQVFPPSLPALAKPAAVDLFGVQMPPKLLGTHRRGASLCRAVARLFGRDAYMQVGRRTRPRRAQRDPGALHEGAVP